MDGLGVRSAYILAPSSFLAYAAVMLSLQLAILPEQLCRSDELAVSYALFVWMTQTLNAEPVDGTRHVKELGTILLNFVSPTKQSSGSRAATWIDNMLTTHLHPRHTSRRKGIGFSWRKSGTRHIRRSQLNDLICKAIKKAQIATTKQPFGLSRTNGKKPGIEQRSSKPLAWDVIVPDIYAQSHSEETAENAWAEGEKAAINNTTKYLCLTTTHHFVPIAIETGGLWNKEATECVYI